MIRYECDNETAGCSNQIAELSAAVSAPWPGNRSKWRLGEFTVRPMIREESLSVNKLTVSSTNKTLRLKNVSLKSRGVYQVNFEYVPLQFYIYIYKCNILFYFTFGKCAMNQKQFGLSEINWRTLQKLTPKSHFIFLDQLCFVMRVHIISENILAS